MHRDARKILVLVLPWIAAGITLVLVAVLSDRAGFARDAKIYRRAVEASHAGLSPYVASLALQQHAQQSGIEEDTWAFVYPPVTLPFVHLVGLMPAWLYETLYWLAYASGALVQLWALFQTILGPAERRVARYLLPACLLFPAFIYSTESIFGGNVVYILYGAVLWGAVAGWRKGNWKWFYLAVILASCVKPQMLALLLVPVFSGAGQWPAAIVTGIGTLCIVGAQVLIWPARYKEWRHTVDVQLLYYDREFGHGPVGLLGRVLWRRGLPYAVPCAIFYLCFASLILTALIYLERLYRQGRLTLTDLLPVLLIGVILLNPRLLGNDIYVLTIPVAAIVWRSLMDLTRSWKAATFWVLAFMLVANLVAIWAGDYFAMGFYAVVVSVVLLSFMVGCRHLEKQARALA